MVRQARAGAPAAGAVLEAVGLSRSFGPIEVLSDVSISVRAGEVHAIKVMQDFLTKHPKIDAVWRQHDDMAIGVFEAIAQTKRSDIKFVVAGAGSKDMVKRVMDGDPMMPVDVLYSPSMVAVAMDLTALGLEDKVPVRGEYILKASLITKDNAKDFDYANTPF